MSTVGFSLSWATFVPLLSAAFGQRQKMPFSPYEQQLVNSPSNPSAWVRVEQGLLELHCPLQAGRNDCTGYNFRQHRAAVILCILPIGSSYCCVTPSSTQAHSITYYLFNPILKTDAQTTRQNTICSLFALYLSPRASRQVELRWYTMHSRHVFKLVTLHNGDPTNDYPDNTQDRGCAAMTYHHTVSQRCSLLQTRMICLPHCLFLMAQEERRSFPQWPAACSEYCCCI